MSRQYVQYIAAAVARVQGELLLVQQQDPGATFSTWGLPGGKIESGEEILAGLRRELLEETGLTLVGTPTIAFILQIFQETEAGIQEWLAFHFACEVAGHIQPQDPDGLVLSAHWVQEQTALNYLEKLSWYDCEPLRRWLSGEAAPGSVYSLKMK